jgi:hypothetical protein
MKSITTKPCETCGGTRRYIRSGGCVRCKERHNRKYRKSLKMRIDAGEDLPARGSPNNLDFKVIRLSVEANLEFLNILVKEKFR